MKRVVCLLVIVSIAYAGCANKKQSKVTVVAHRNGWYTPGDWKSNAVLMQENVRLRDELYKVKTMHKPNKALLAKIAELGTEIDSQRTELRTSISKLKKEISEAKRMSKPDEALLVKVADIEAGIKSLRTELRTSITKLKEELSEAKIMPEQYEALLVRIADIQAALELQMAEERAE